MKEFKGTKGKWQVEINTNQPNYITNEDGSKAIAFIPWKHPQAIENIKLIASAPELLQALSATLALINSTFRAAGWDCDEYSEVIKGREVINKALGIKED